MAKTRAMVDIVGTEPLAYQLLEQVGLFIGALRRTETRQRGTATFPDDILQAEPE